MGNGDAAATAETTDGYGWHGSDGDGRTTDGRNGRNGRFRTAATTAATARNGRLRTGAAATAKHKFVVSLPDVTRRRIGVFDRMCVCVRPYMYTAPCPCPLSVLSVLSL